MEKTELQEINERVLKMNVEECLRVVRFSPPATTASDLAFKNACYERMGHLRRLDPVAFTAASKNLGW